MLHWLKISPRLLSFYAMGALLLTGVYLTSWHSYLLFHTVSETFSILVAFSIFLFAWNTLRFVRDRYLIVLGVAYLFIGGFDFVHLLSYKGLGIIHGDGSNHATQLWIIARYMESLTLLAVPFVIDRRVDHRLLFALYGSISAALLLLVFVFHSFPTCYVEGVGLTPFKIISEYIICAILIGAGAALYLKRKELDSVMFRLLLASIVFTMASELAFTSYVSVYGPANMLGHLLKIISSYLIYRATVAHGLLFPYRNIFRELARNKQALEHYSQKLESRVAQRTADLEKSYRELRHLSDQLVNAQEQERRRISRDLHDSIGQSLSAIKLSVENVVSNFDDRYDAKARQAMERLVPMTQTAIREVRRIIMDLRPAILDRQGIVPTINWFCQDFNEIYSGIRIEKHLSVEEAHLPDKIKTTIFRLLQETFNNIGKHSGARCVRVSLVMVGDRVLFEVWDDGCGFDRQATGNVADRAGFGLAGMRERAEMSGAEFEIQTRPGEGTAIRASWPMAPSAGQVSS